MEEPKYEPGRVYSLKIDDLTVGKYQPRISSTNEEDSIEDLAKSIQSNMTNSTVPFNPQEQIQNCPVLR